MFAVLLFVLVNFDAYNGPGVMNHEILKTKLESCFITRYFGFIAWHFTFTRLTIQSGELGRLSELGKQWSISFYGLIEQNDV